MVRIEKQVTIDAPQEQVWAVLADFGSVAKWVPTVNHSVITSGPNGGVAANANARWTDSARCGSASPTGARARA